MSEAKGKRKKFGPLQVSGIDTRVWQKEGSASDIKGALFTVRGEVVKAEGIKPLYDHIGGAGQLWPGMKGLGPSNSPTPFNGPMYALGAFHHDGMTDILVQFNDAGAEFSSLVVIRAQPGGQTMNFFSALNGLSPARGPGDSYRFVQSGDILICTNGVDPNYKWDGYKFSPLGISELPPAPNVPVKSVADLSVSGVTPTGDFPSTSLGPCYIENASKGLWESYCIKVDTSAVEPQRFSYRMTWVNDKGQESEAGPPSNTLTDAGWMTTKSVVAGSLVPFPEWGDNSGAYYVIRVQGLSADAPSSDIVARHLYRSTDGGLTWIFHSRLPGNSTENMWDYVRPGVLDASAALKEDGSGKPPPIAKWAFVYRTRTYYGGLPAMPSTIAYSNKDGGKEGVATASYVDLASHTPDGLTGYAGSQDYALVFKRRSFYMLTHDKEELPILTPISQGVGAGSDKAIASFEGTTYWLSEMGFYSYDGSKEKPMSMELNERFKTLPPSKLRDAFAWIDQEERRVFFSLCGGPGSENKEVWAIHVDTGAFSVLDGYELFSAVHYDKYTYVSYKDTKNNYYDLGLWGVQSEIGGYHSPDPVLPSTPTTGAFETSWLTLENPNSDKTFQRLDIYYIQSTSRPMDVSWFLDWDDRYVGSKTMNLMANEATVWQGAGSPVTWGSGLTWDSGRVRSLRVDLQDSEERPLHGKCIKFRIRDLDLASSTETPWRIVGFLLHYTDFGTRSEGTDISGTA